MALVKVNADLLKERANATFDIQELTHFLNGGKHVTALKKKIGKFFLCENKSFSLVDCLF